MPRSRAKRLLGAREKCGIDGPRARTLVPALSLALTLFLALGQATSSAIAQAGVSGGSAAVQTPGTERCFLRREWEGTWKTTPDSRTIYIGVADRIYRVDLDTAYPLLKSPWTVLSDADSNDAICNAIDFKLVLFDPIGIREAIIVRRVTLLTRAETAALPKSLRP